MTKPVNPSSGGQNPDDDSHNMPEGSLGDFLENKVFPEDWVFTPLKEKHPATKRWTTNTFTLSEVTGKYKAGSFYDGVGVVTGEASGGLIALDIDGYDADERYKRIAGDEYRPRGEEGTMAWTSGQPGRRQILWRVPKELVPVLRNVVVLQAKLDDSWEPGKFGAPKRDKNGNVIETEEERKARLGRPQEELVLRFNKCQSVLPGSRHPSTKTPYRFLSYNDGVPAPAPQWIIDLLWKYSEPVAWLKEDELRDIASETGSTLIPPKQIRGWFFKEQVQQALYPRLEELVFNHPVFDRFGWTTREGSPPQRMSGCPWHETTSATSFQYNPENGLWCCHACQVGGDPLDFIHKIETGDMYADRPIGAELERYVQPIAEKLGFQYPEDLQIAQKTTEVPKLELSPSQFFDRLRQIQKTVDNPAECLAAMADLAAQSGRRMTGVQCQEALQEREYYRLADLSNENNKWHESEAMNFLIPNLILRPSQVMLHSAPGLGKTSTAMAIAASLLYGRTIRIRGIAHQLPKCKVLWIQNDQSNAKFKRDCEDNEVYYEDVKDTLIVKRGFQLNHLHQLRKWIITHRPDLVVIDSIGSCSTHMTVQEKDKAYATPFYKIGEMNGAYSPTYEQELKDFKAQLEAQYPPTWVDTDKGCKMSEEGRAALSRWYEMNEWQIAGFPATSFLYIHHDNANGEARGTRYLPAAMDEQWHLRKVLDDERSYLQEKGLVPGDCRFIQIKKSRSGREGDRLIVRKHIEGKFEIDDFTPTEKKGDEGQGDPEPSTMALKLVKDGVLARRRGEAPSGEEQRAVLPKGVTGSNSTERTVSGAKVGIRYLDETGVTSFEVFGQINDLLVGQGRSTVTNRTVRRWLKRWYEDGVVLRGKDLLIGKKRTPTYTVPKISKKEFDAIEWGEDPASGESQVEPDVDPDDTN